ncbi:AAA family ATPase [Enterococcus faecalis]|uniref:AAA family ATPase n=1 Tax=Enterococcus faecalis TaxID=1351 RepID=A0AAP6RGV1_ENTFL|nr:AAA family ATPase [Enterococcus faecalis]MXS29375.1 AAA family ATPase [Enterococcus faecalis]MXS52588.1 AAA family ATPase [Enterococcus faecalis]
MKINLTGNPYIFQDKEIELKNKNFIFGKNGSGKSTLCDLIKLQKHYFKVERDKEGKLIEVIDNDRKVLADDQEDKFDVRIFQGFESVIGEDNSLNAIALSGENKDVVSKIKKAEQDLKSLGEEKAELTKAYIKAKKKFDDQDSKIDNWYKRAAKSIKENTQYQVEPNYNKAKFQRDLEKKVKVTNLEELTKTITETPKNPVKQHLLYIPNLGSLLNSVNEILVKTVEISHKCEELDNPIKETFAKDGLRLHKEDDQCLFCGNKLTKERLSKLNRHFNEEYKKLEQEILSFNIEKVAFQKLNQQEFYSNFDVEKINASVLEKQNEVNIFIESLQKAIAEKKEDITKIFKKLALVLPEIDNLQKEIDELIVNNNEFGNNLSKNISDAKCKVRLHLVAIECEKFSFDVEKNNLDNFKKQIPDTTEITERIKDKNEEIQNFKAQQKDTTKITNLINERLKKSGKEDLQLVKVEDDGLEKYEVHDGEGKTRSISHISTGEKNIIAFLYFIYSLEDIDNQSGKPKIIIFDDPMNSNDDTMQYLIITELQKLYQGKEISKFNPQDDYFLCLTHNIHFYLNIQPHGNFKDQNGKTKYDKNNFYRIENHKLKLVTNEKEDFKTNYAGLWVELNELCEHDFKYAILNSMRRIIETFVKFNNLNPQAFYKDNEQYLKLFNVNSHSIDDLTQEQFTETTDELKKIFENIFKENEFEDHFNNYWAK